MKQSKIYKVTYYTSDCPYCSYTTSEQTRASVRDNMNNHLKTCENSKRKIKIDKNEK